MNYNIKAYCIFFHQAEAIIILAKKNPQQSSNTKLTVFAIFCLSYITMITNMSKLPE